MSSYVRGARELSGGTFIRAPNLFVRASPSWCNHLPKLPFPNTILWALEFNMWILGEYKYSVYGTKVTFTSIHTWVSHPWTLLGVLVFPAPLYQSPYKEQKLPKDSSITPLDWDSLREKATLSTFLNNSAHSIHLVNKMKLTFLVIIPPFLCFIDSRSSLLDPRKFWKLIIL